MVKVLHVLGSLNRGGIETWLLHVLRHIDRSRFQLDFCCLSGEEGVLAPEARALGSRVFPLRLGKNLPAFNRRFARLLRDEPYDIVHSHVHQFSGYILRLAAKSGVTGRIAHSFTAPRNGDTTLYRRLYGRLMHHWLAQNMTLGLGNSLHSMVSLFGPTWRQEPRCQLLYCGIDLAPFAVSATADIRAQHGIPADAPLIGHVGSLNPVKNHRFMLEVAATLEAVEPAAWFVFVGDGPLRAELAAATAQKGLRQVVFSGPVAQIVPYLQSMDLFLFPSLWEGLPQSVIEAQAAGLRCLCSDVITDEIAVVPQAVQFMALDRPPAAWAAEVQRMLARPPLDRGAAWQTVAASPFAIECSVQALCRLYLEGAR